MRKVAVEAGEHLAPLGLELQVSAVVSRRLGLGLGLGLAVSG